MLLFNNDEAFPDDYQPGSNTIQKLFRDGTPLRTKDLHEMQSITFDTLRRGFDALYRNGTVLEGLLATTRAAVESSIEVNISSGVIYADGAVLDVKGARFFVPSIGSTRIAVTISTRYEDEIVDGLPTATRLILDTALNINPSDGYPVICITDGVLTYLGRGVDNALEDALALAATERHGNFLVEGYSVTLDNPVTGIATTQLDSVEREYSLLSEKSNDARARYLEARARFDGLKVRLRDAELVASVSPTAANINLRTDLQQRVSSEEKLVARYEDEYLRQQAAAVDALSRLEEAKGTALGGATVTVGTGVAYIDGKRVVLDAPKTVILDRTTASQETSGLTITYTGTSSRTLRTFSTNVAWSSVVASSTLVTMTLTGLLEGVNVLTATITASTSGTTSLDNFIEFILTRTLSNTANDANYSLSIPGRSLEQARAILKDNISLQRGIFPNSILITAVGPTTTTNTIGVSIAITGTALSIDIPFANLTGASSTNTFPLPRRPVREINRLNAVREENLRAIVRGVAPGTTDDLGKDTIQSITRVISGSTTYRFGIDYTLIDGARIDWSLSGIEPAPGTTYFVSYKYNEDLILDKDYKLDRPSNSLIFIGRTPVINGTFTVDYTYYLARIGMVTLDRQGRVAVVYGEPSVNPLPPPISSTVLPLAAVTISGIDATIRAVDTRPLTFSTTRDLRDAVTALSQDLLSLRAETRAERLAVETTGTLPTGIHSDIFNNLDKLDLSATTGSLSPISQSLDSNYQHEDVLTKYVGSGTVKLVTDDASQRSATITYTESTYLEQSKATRTREVTARPTPIITLSHPLVFANRGANRLTPLDTLASKVTGSGENPLYDFVNESTRSEFTRLGETVRNSIATGTALGRVDTGIAGNEYLFEPLARNVRITVRVENVKPNGDGYQFFFDDKLITNGAPGVGYPISTLRPHSYRSEGNGSLEMYFFLPPVPPGTYPIEVRGNGEVVRTSISIFNTLLHHIALGGESTWTTNIVTPSARDAQPIACGVEPEALCQTFRVEQDLFITAINIKIAELPADGMLQVTLRDSKDDRPGRNILGRAVVSGVAIADKRARRWTRLNFDRPILLRGRRTYTLGLSTTGGPFVLHTSEIGRADVLDASKLVGGQLLVEGNLWLNNAPLEREDIAFRIQRAVFPTNTATVDLGIYEDTLFNAITINTRDLVPPSCRIDYEYKLDEDITWRPLTPNKLDIMNVPRRKLSLRAKLTGTPFLSPQIYVGSTVSLYWKKAPNTFTSKYITLPPTRNYVVAVTAAEPPGSVIQVQVQFRGDAVPTNLVQDNIFTSLDPSIGLVRRLYRLALPAERGSDIRYFINAIGVNGTPTITEVLLYGY